MNPIPVSIVMALAATNAGLPQESRDVVWFAGAHQTPLPGDLWMPSAPPATGQDLVGPVANLVHDAAMVVRTLAFLPVDEDAERREEARCLEILPVRTFRTLSNRKTRTPQSLG